MLKLKQNIIDIIIILGLIGSRFMTKQVSVKKKFC